MNKEEVITRVRTERIRWSDIVALMDDGMMLKPGVEGHWSVKDVLAHVVWYEREMVGMLSARALVGSDLWALPLEERNARIYEETKDMALEEVRAEWSRECCPSSWNSSKRSPKTPTATHPASQECPLNGSRGS